MPSEHDRNIEKLLRAYADKRREDGAGFDLHPTTRRMLQGEVSRMHAGQKAGGGSSWSSALFRYWRPLAFAASLFLVLGTTLLIVTKPWTEKRTDFARAEAPSRQIESQNDALSESPDGSARASRAPIASPSTGRPMRESSATPPPPLSAPLPAAPKLPSAGGPAAEVALSEALRKSEAGRKMAQDAPADAKAKLFAENQVRLQPEASTRRSHALAIPEEKKADAVDKAASRQATSTRLQLGRNESNVPALAFRDEQGKDSSAGALIAGATQTSAFANVALLADNLRFSYDNLNLATNFGVTFFDSKGENFLAQSTVQTAVPIGGFAGGGGTAGVQAFFNTVSTNNLDLAKKVERGKAPGIQERMYNTPIKEESETLRRQGSEGKRASLLATDGLAAIAKAPAPTGPAPAQEPAQLAASQSVLRNGLEEDLVARNLTRARFQQAATREPRSNIAMALSPQKTPLTPKGLLGEEGLGGEGDQRSPPPGVLDAFDFERVGETVRITDADGSVYQGGVLAQTNKGDRASRADDRRAGKPVTETESVLNFRAGGTNRTTRQFVLINGALVGPFENATRANWQFQQRNRVDALDAPPERASQRGTALTDKSGQTQVLRPQTRREFYRVQGSARIGATNQIQIDAVPASPEP